MNTDERQGTDWELGPVEASARVDFAGLHTATTKKVIAVFFEVYNELGGGFLESVYQQAMRIAITQSGFKADAEVPVPVMFRGQVVGNYRADLVVEDCVLLELKAVSSLDRTHDGQILHYLRATSFEIGLLMNFGPRPQFKRFILENERRISVLIRVNPWSSLRRLSDEYEDWLRL